eukprot:GHVH01001758.1.p1 GENE.GHVH01001758.1~~GHVH01001758.1.p1  ORF type:complete len:234 (+),score=31.14 GHVH01001758.1:82-783(+)
MGVPEIHYWDATGRDSPIRCALELSGTEYKMVRPEGPEQMKQNAGTESNAFGQLPVFKTAKGAYIAGTGAILRHVARRGGLYGTKDKDIDEIELVLEGIESARGAFIKDLYVAGQGFAGMTDEKLNLFIENYGKSTPGTERGGFHFEYLSNIIAKHGPTHHLVADTLTIADINMLDVYTLFKFMPVTKDFLDKHYPLIAQFESFIFEKHQKVKDFYGNISLESGKIVRKIVNQ